MNEKKRIISLYLLLFLFSSKFIFGQEFSRNVLWDKTDNIPISYATIKGFKKYSISNEDGVFEFQKTTHKVTIQSVVYENLEVNYNFLQKNDTIYLSPLTYELDAVEIKGEGKFNKMLKTISTDYALEPHYEEFFLRAVVRKNDSLYKIVDFSGFLRKETLFGTSNRPKPKKNYTIQINNIRKAGKENKDVDFEMISFEYLLEQLSSIYLSPKEYNLEYKITEDKDNSKIIFTPKNTSNPNTGTYILGSDNTFNETEIIFNDEGVDFEKSKNFKFKTPYMYKKSNFERNTKTGKIQLSKGLLKSKTLVYPKDNGEDIFNVTYIYSASPINEMNLKNNIKLNRDLFEIKGDYDPDYWSNIDVLPLTKEMQYFINKMNSSQKNSDFKTRTNIH